MVHVRTGPVRARLRHSMIGPLLRLTTSLNNPDAAPSTSVMALFSPLLTLHISNDGEADESGVDLHYSVSLRKPCAAVATRSPASDEARPSV